MSEVNIAALVRRLDHLESDGAIMETTYAYGRGLDYGERDTFLDCFTVDARYRGRHALGGPAVREYRGRQDLAEHYEWHTHAPDAWHKHLTMNVSVTIDGDTATAISYFVRLDLDASSPKPATSSSSGRYLDTFAREGDGAWRIRTRHIEVENH
jgi:hypothetical protein